jgi:hypothetical protein
MSDKEKKGPDHTLANADIPDKDEAPKIYAVVDLKAYVKPEMDDELSRPDGEAATYDVETVCECVPVEDCACNTVSHYEGSDPCAHGACHGLYWYPY